jgi:hypothetical protein
MNLTSSSTSASPNCVRTGVASLRRVKNPVDTAGMDEIEGQLAALKPVTLDKESDTPTYENISPMSVFTMRNIIFNLLIHMGNLSSQFVDVTRIYENHSTIGTILSQMIVLLIDISSGVSINLYDACVKKIQLNSRKYPVELCKVRKHYCCR